MRRYRLTAAAALLALVLAGCSRTPHGPAGSPSTPAPSTVSSTPPATGAPTTPAPPTATTPVLPAALLGRDLERLPTTNRLIALTFDAGANGDSVPSILSTLAQQQVPATFFLTGDFVNDFADLARSIATAGHPIGNHSQNHPYFTQLSDEQIRAQLRDAAAAIAAATGSPPGPFFRFPYGDRNSRTISLVNAAGYLAVRWTVDSLGWQGTMGGTRDAGFVSQRVLAAASPGAIVLMHVGSNPDDHSTLDADALPAIIATLRANGYSFVTLDALLT